MIKKLLNISNNRKLNKIRKIVEKSMKNNLDNKKLSDSDLKEKTLTSKILEEQLSLIAEISKRTLGLTPFKVQLEAILALTIGYSVEMKTGEGKTLVTGLAAVLDTLNGNRTFVVTVNDYLTDRDAKYNKPVFDFLDINVGVINNNLDIESKKQQYLCDIVYGTSSTFAFDYLKDNMVIESKHRVNKGIFKNKNLILFDSVIIDEVDSVLIDESRVPLIISGQNEDQNNEIIMQAQSVFKNLILGNETEERSLINSSKIESGDFIVNKKDRNTFLTEAGVSKVEKLLKIDNLYDSKNQEILHRISQAIVANSLYSSQKEYSIKNGKIVLIDQSTGRLSEGRQLGDGLHQAIEAKESLDITFETIKESEITYQNFFKLFNKISGISGTVKTEEEEFLSIYGLETLVINTNVKIKRIDHTDKIFLTKKSKIEALLKIIKNQDKIFAPILIGTSNVEENEEIASIFRENNIKFNQLNAENEFKEAEIIEHAGEVSTITLATNMAGRGVDIKISNESRSLGGLTVIGFGRYNNRRIDNQLRGRSGRQGDPGNSIFLISLEDDLIQVFGQDNKLLKTVRRLGFKDSEEITSKMVSKAIEKAQKTIEGMEFKQRKDLMKYDSVLASQRLKFYEIRNNIIDLEDFKDMITKIETLIEARVNELNILEILNSEDYEQLNIVFAESFNMEFSDSNIPDDINQVINFLKHLILNKLIELDKNIALHITKGIYLNVLDSQWRSHLHSLNSLEKGSNLQSYNQKDPVTEYQKESFKVFKNDFLINSKKNILLNLINTQIKLSE